MQFTQTAEYALRVVAQLAVQNHNEARRAQELSTQTGIPLHYLSKIMRKLVQAGLLHSRKGHGGGFRLAKPRSDIRFIDVLNAVGYELDPDKCAFGWEACSHQDPCPLHPFWTHLKNEVIHWAEHHTLADVQHDESD